jgi:two-component system sensor histidine kinase UhpB
MWFGDPQLHIRQHRCEHKTIREEAVLELFIGILLISALLGLLLAIYIARSRPAPGAQALLVLNLAACIWSMGYALEIATTNIGAKLFWAKVEYLGIVTIPLAWLIFAAQYTGSPAWILNSRRNRILLGVIPATTLCLVWTNELHGWIWLNEGIRFDNSIPMLELTHGPWFWIQTAYNYLLLIIGSVWLIRAVRGSTRLHQWQVGITLTAILFPWMVNLLYLSDLNPLPDIDWTPFAFVVSGFLLTIGLLRFSLVKILPVAQKTIFDGLIDGVIVLDLQDYIIAINPAAEKLLGMIDNRAHNQSLSQLSSELAGLIEQARSSEKYRVEIPWGEGQNEGCYDLSISALPDIGGIHIGRLVVFHDITQRKQQEALLEQTRDELEIEVSVRTEELRQANLRLSGELAQRTVAENRFSQIVEMAPDAIVLINQQAEIVLVNARTEQMFGIPRADLLGKHINVLQPIYIQNEHLTWIKQFFSSPMMRQMAAGKELFARRKDGSEFPFEIHLAPLTTVEGTQVACVIRDISERRQALQSLRESERFYRALFENANDAILLMNVNGSFQQVNQVAADMLGYSIDELLGKSIVDIVPLEEKSVAKRNINALLSRKTLPIFDRRYRRKDGTIFPAEVNLSIISDIDGKPRLFQAIIRDKTESKKAEREQVRLLEELQKSEEQLHALAARLEEVREIERKELARELHDRVGTSLTGMNLNLNILQSLIPAAQREPIQGLLDEMQSLVEDTTRQVRDVMSDLHPPMLDEYGLVSALHWYCNNYSQHTGMNALVDGEEFKPRLPRNVEMVLFRIVQEALNNVAKHTKATHVLVGLKETGKAYRLRILDNGSGFDPKKISNPNEGPHWGLLIMQERAASVGGRVRVYSAPGKGSCITVIIRRNLDAD